MKSYLGPMGYTIYKDSVPKKELLQIKKDLTVRAIAPGVPKHLQPKPFKIYKESDRKLYIPKYYGTEKFGIPSKIMHNNGEPITLEFAGSLRPKQIPIVESYLSNVRKHRDDGFGGIISVPCGWGKTVMATYIISAIKVRTIIFVHKEFLMKQFEEEIHRFLPGAAVGRIQGKTIDVEGKDIVLAMIQSITMKDYPRDLFNDFGLSIYDECHHIGASVFCKCPRKVPTKYTLGLSATPDRKDGLRNVFEWYLGKLVYEVKERNDAGVDVRIIKYSHDDKNFNDIPMNGFGKPNRAKLITNIADFGPRKRAICRTIQELTEEEDGQTLILADRRSLLTYLHDWCEANGISVGYYVGGMKQKDLDISATKKFIVSTYAMSSEGMNIPSLNRLILATPKSDIIQSVGRILRLKPEDRILKPIVIDFVDPHECLVNSYRGRLRFYKKNGYNILMYSCIEGNIEFIKEFEYKKKKDKQNNMTNKNKSINITIKDNISEEEEDLEDDENNKKDKWNICMID
jgi:superfamily II DNA or RNA helicase